MKGNITVSIQKKVLIYFLIMFGIVSAGVAIYMINAQKVTQKLSLSVLSKDVVSLLDNLSFYTTDIQQGKMENLVAFKSDIEKVEQFMSILKQGGEFSSEGHLYRLESVQSAHQKEFKKILAEWEEFKNLGMSISPRMANTAGAEKVLIIKEKNEFIRTGFELLLASMLDSVSKSEKIYSYLLLITVFSVVVGLLLGYNFVLNTAIKPLGKITSVSKSLALGESIEELPERSKDEIGNLFRSINLLNKNLTIISDFANAIGNGNFEVNFEPRGDKDMLGHALLNMRNNLRKVALEDSKRNWTNENLAYFGELLRVQHENLDELSYRVINKLVDCMEANQGGFFLLSEDGHQLELKSAFAYEKRKYLQKVVNSDEGLVGQCLQEAKPIYLKEIPEDYMEITSGLGGSRPSSVLLLPLLYNDVGYGVIELSSFTEIDEHKIKFAEVVAEDIASSLSILKANEKTKTLLRESQEKNEHRKVQEKQMREQLTELESSREQWHKKEQELNLKYNRFKYLADDAPVGLLVLKMDKKVAYHNAYIEKFYKSKGIYIGNDISITQLVPSNELKDWHASFENARSGEVVTKIVNWKHIKNHDIYLQVMITINKNLNSELEGNGAFNGWIVRINDITHLQPVRW